LTLTLIFGGQAILASGNRFNEELRVDRILE